MTKSLFTSEESRHADPEGSRYVRVAVERGIDAAAGEGLTYRCDAAVEIGQRVDVPLGRGNKPASGIVVAAGGRELLDGLSPSKVKPVAGVLRARLPPRLVELARWMSDYYVCPLGMTLAAMIPAAVKHDIGTRIRVVVRPVGPERAAGILGAAKLPPLAMKAWESLSKQDLGGDADARELAARLGLKTAAPINALVRAGLLEEHEKAEVRVRAGVLEREAAAVRDVRVEMTPAQHQAAEGISSGLEAFGVHLLHGVTGSGKTEVYLQLLEQVIALGKTGLVLVPEISLTPQTAGRFIARFKDRGAVAVLHSGLTASERHRQWALAASGAIVAVGARSAVFAPIPRLGLIVVDEEHAGDYKQDQLPRYHGRDVAIKRAQLEGCPVVLGSATPSLESWSNAQAGRSRLWRLPERVGGGTMPRVEVVDLAEERRREPTPGRELRSIGPRLEKELRTTLEGGGQAILLLNRRGYSSFVSCSAASCGWVMRCEQCDASLVLHRAGMPPGGVLRCHHCLAEHKGIQVCPVCGRKVIALGAGTQRLEAELKHRLGDVIDLERDVARADGDSMRSAADWFALLDRFDKGEIRILLGTQMIAKGLDFPNVRLVGVINADVGLSLPDFRCAERVFQLISQVAGRAGRGHLPGRVIVQTMNPEEPAIRMAAAHDYHGFVAGELAIRREAGLPPITRMARIVVRDENHDAAAARAKDLGERLRDAGGVRVIGPAPCPIARIAGHFRFGIEVIAPTAARLHATLHGLRTAGVLKSDAATAVDVDPVALM